MTPEAEMAGLTFPAVWVAHAKGGTGHIVTATAPCAWDPTRTFGVALCGYESPHLVRPRAASLQQVGCAGCLHRHYQGSCNPGPCNLEDTQ